MLPKVRACRHALEPAANVSGGHPSGATLPAHPGTREGPKRGLSHTPAAVVAPHCLRKTRALNLTLHKNAYAVAPRCMPHALEPPFHVPAAWQRGASATWPPSPSSHLHRALGERRG